MFKFIKNLTIFLFVLGFFVFSQAVEASINQIGSDVPDETYGINNVFQKLGTGLSENVQAFYLMYDNWSTCVAGNYTPHVYLVECPSDLYTTCTTVLQIRNGEVFCGTEATIIYFQAGINSDLAMGTPATTTYQMLSDKYYYIRQEAGEPDWAPYDLWTYGTNGSGNNFTPPEVADCDSFGTPCDYDYLYFKILNTDDVNELLNRVVRETPVNNVRLYDNNVSFTGTYTTNSSFDQVQIKIVKLTSATTSEEYINIEYEASEGEDLAFTKEIYLPDGNYSYIAYMHNYDTGENGYDYDEYPWYFVIGTNTPQIIPGRLVEGRTENEKILVYCDQEATTTPGTAYEWLSKWIVDGIRDTICYLFIPNQGFIDALGDSAYELRTKAPIGYISLISDEFEDIATSTVATTSPATISATDYNLFKALNNLGLFNTIRTILSYLMLIVALIYVYKRIKHLIKV